MVLNNSFQPKGRRHGIAEPEIETGHCSEIATCTQRGAVKALPAAIKSRRRGTRAVLVLEPRFFRPVEHNSSH